VNDLPGAARSLRGVPDGAERTPEDLIRGVVRGDAASFAALYDALAPQVFGLTWSVLRNPAQAEEVTQEVFLEVWRTATHYDAQRAGVRTWVLTLAHRRAVDRVRSEQASTDRDARAAARDAPAPPHDEVEEAVHSRLESQQVRRCMDSLSDLQREAVGMAYWSGYTHTEVAQLLDAPLGTVKTRIRDGLIRLRDCMGVTA
jgi:RNA polymerase sigma-70 factor (ECF subfamily)